MPAAANRPFHEPIIRHTPGVVGGSAHIRDTRIPVWLLVDWRKKGHSDAVILREFYPGQLVQGDLDAAWEYFDCNRAEIERDLSENEE
jgi:uncharacterized protein (DUF433 family)